MRNTAPAPKVYDHRPRPWRAPDSGAIECRVCGVAVAGYDEDTLYHQGQATKVVPVTVATADWPAFEASRAVIRDALADPGLAPELTDALADTAARELYRRGILKVRKAAWRQVGDTVAA